MASPAPALLDYDAALPRRQARAVADLLGGFLRWRLAWALAILDLRNRYRGSVLGPFWLTLSTGVMLGALGLLYSTLFRLELSDYLPFLAVSLIVWQLVQQLIAEGCASLTSAESVIRQLPLPHSVHALRCMLRNALVAAHNLPLIVLVLAAFGHLPGTVALLALPGALLLLLNGFAAALFLGMLCARFRDIGPIVASVMQIAFFVTPVIWKPELIPDYAFLLPLNPFFAVMETLRAPLLGHPGGLAVWAAAILFTGIHLGVAFAFFVRFRGRVAFWV
jgi:lipopolysaccharide transport system permease protein